MEFRDTDSCQRKRSSWKPKVCYPASNPRLHTDGRANDSTIRQGHIVAVDSKSHPYTVLITLCSCYNIIICHTFLCFFKFSERLGEKMLDFLYKQKHKITETFIHSFILSSTIQKQEQHRLSASTSGCLQSPSSFFPRLRGGFLSPSLPVTTTRGLGHFPHCIFTPPCDEMMPFVIHFQP